MLALDLKQKFTAFQRLSHGFPLALALRMIVGGGRVGRDIFPIYNIFFPYQSRGGNYIKEKSKILKLDFFVSRSCFFFLFSWILLFLERKHVSFSYFLKCYFFLLENVFSFSFLKIFLLKILTTDIKQKFVLNKFKSW